MDKMAYFSGPLSFILCVLSTTLSLLLQPFHYGARDGGNDLALV